LIDPGAVIFHFDPAASEAEITYTNLVPEVEITTLASDPVDGDKFVVLPGAGGHTTQVGRGGANGPDGTSEIDRRDGTDGTSETGGTSETDRRDGTAETVGRGGTDEIDALGGSGQVVDVVSYCGLVPGTGYTVDGSIQVFADGLSPVPSGVSAARTFIPGATCGEVEVIFVVPEDSVLLGNVGVVFERLTLTSTGALVVEHADPDDEAQIVFFPSISTDLHVEDEDPSESQDHYSRGRADASGRPNSSAGAAHSFSGHIGVAGSQLVDVVNYSGLAPDALYRAELALYQRDREGQCVATNVVTSIEFTATESSGAVTVAGAVVPAPGVYVGYERIYRVRDIDDIAENGSSVEDGSSSSASGDDDERGSSAEKPIDEDRSGDTLVASHENCDDQAQTVWVLGMETAVAWSVVTGSGEMTDTFTILGLADGLPEGVTAVVEGALHHHSGRDRGDWTCDADNLVEQFAVEVDSDGDYRSPGERHGIGWYSYDNRFVVTFEDGANLKSERFGCGVKAESFEARPPDRPPTTPPPPVTSPPPVVQQPPVAPPRSEPPPTTTPPSLPKTGGGDSGRVQLLAVLLVLVGGSLYLFTPASALPFPRRRRFRNLCQQILERHR
jgi:hypothetical protein